MSEETAPPAYLPSKLQLFLLDLVIISIQTVLLTVVFETSVYRDSSDLEAPDLLLPEDVPSLSIPLFQSPANNRPSTTPLTVSPKLPSESGTAHGRDLPLILDIRFSFLLNQLSQPNLGLSISPHPDTNKIGLIRNQHPYVINGLGAKSGQNPARKKNQKLC
uniref:Uncharacterized protein n=1 Tax=Psilocybe cubensis TaxID=181762 RepID=A0A8H7Y819_PSICU